MILALRAIQWYNSRMSTDAHHKSSRTAMMPVTTMEEVPVLSENERAEMLASLRAAEGRIAAGHYSVYDPQTFKDRLLGIYRAAKNAKTA